MATKKVNVQLLTRIAGLGKEGEIIEVSQAQATNYLVPKKLAKLVTENMLTQAQETQKAKEERKFQLVKNAHSIIEELQGKDVVLELSGGKERTFGSIREADIVQAIRKTYKISLEERHIVFPDGKHIKKQGDYEVKVVLGKDLLAKITVQVRIK